MNWVGLILGAILGRFYLVFERISRAFKEKERQEKADRAISDPSGAIADHFGGRVFPLPGSENCKTDKTDN